MFLDEVTPHELGFSEEEWNSLSLGEKRVTVAFFARRTPIATARALGVRPSGWSTIRRQIVKLELAKRFTMVKQVRAPHKDCQTKQEVGR